MAKSKKTRKNPNRIPVSKADIQRAKKGIVNDAVLAAQVIMFSVLRDKEGVSIEDLNKIWKEVEYLSDSISKGYVSIKDFEVELRNQGIFC